MELKGLYMHVPECGHTYGISSINEPDLYDRLQSLFFQNRGGRWFLQSESERTCLGDKSFLFILSSQENLEIFSFEDELRLTQNN